jgi:acyl-CoA thioesterase-1
MHLFRNPRVAAKIAPDLPSYGGLSRPVQAFIVALVSTAFLLVAHSSAKAADRPVKIVVLGDSLTSGLGLPGGQAFPVKLGRALKAKGIAADIVDAGVSGDTTSNGLARLDWSVPEGTDAVIVELGANDALRGVNPKVTRSALDAIVGRLKTRGAEVLVAGMVAPPNLGAEYVRAFNPIFPEIAAAHGALYYPFFLEGVATQAKFNQRDGLHPNAAGVDVIVAGILPKVEELVTKVRAKQGL